MEEKKDLKKFKYENFKEETISFLKDVVVIVIIVFFIRTFLILPFQIKGSSMAESYYSGEFIIVDRLSYRFSEPKRGDVIVFKPNVNKEKEFFIKRIIGLPGEKLKIENGSVYIYSEEKDKYEILREGGEGGYIKAETFVGADRLGTHEYEIPEGSYFVMGDNRNGSTDSRECFSSCSKSGATNYTTSTNIIGKVWLDLGYFNIGKLKFISNNGNETYPRFFSSPSSAYNVSFDTNSGSEILSQQIAKGHNVSKPEDPTKEGYSFVGWYKDSGFLEEFDFSEESTITKDTIIYAKWEESEDNSASIGENLEE